MATSGARRLAPSGSPPDFGDVLLDERCNLGHIPLRQRSAQLGLAAASRDSSEKERSSRDASSKVGHGHFPDGTTNGKPQSSTGFTYPPVWVKPGRHGFGDFAERLLQEADVTMEAFSISMHGHPRSAHDRQAEVTSGRSREPWMTIAGREGWTLNDGAAEENAEDRIGRRLAHATISSGPEDRARSRSVVRGESRSDPDREVGRGVQCKAPAERMSDRGNPPMASRASDGKFNIVCDVSIQGRKVLSVAPQVDRIRGEAELRSPNREPEHFLFASPIAVSDDGSPHRIIRLDDDAWKRVKIDTSYG